MAPPSTRLVSRPTAHLSVLPVAKGTFVYLRLRRLVTLVFSALFINRLTYLPICHINVK